MSEPRSSRQRREQVAKMRQQQEAKDRRRRFTIIGICGVIALAIVGVGLFAVYQENRQRAELSDTAVADIGQAARGAGCAPVRETLASGSNVHVNGPVNYEEAPPSYGPHRPTAVPSGVHMFTPSDRPELELLVHNLEHGWTLVWYDSTVAEDPEAMAALRRTAEKFDLQGNDPRYNVMMVPWLDDDAGGEPIPDGRHVAFTHWSIHRPVYRPAPPPTDAQGNVKSWGVTQTCDTFSGEALDSFMQSYPYDDAPEGYLWH